MTLGELIAQLGGKLAHGERRQKMVTGVNGLERATATELLFAEDADAAKQRACEGCGGRGGEAGMRCGLCECGRRGRD